MRLEEYARLDGLALAELVRRREVTALELAELAVEAAASVAEPLNAVVEAYVDEAWVPREAGGPFAGVPIMLKDLFHGDAGRACGNGSRLSRGWVAPVESELVRRLRRAGFVNVGRTTTSEFGVMGTTETVAHGRTCSPWSAERMAGGSSGGSAAATGAGVVPVATASDGGGSIRIPASACGVVGLKPTRGRVTWGPAAGDPLSGWAVHFVVTRSVRDTAAALDALGGWYPGGARAPPAPPRPYAEEVGAPSERLRVAYWHGPWSGGPGDPQVQAACEATAGVLEELGHDVERARPELDWPAFVETMAVVWSASTADTIDWLAQTIGRKPEPETLEAPTLAMLEYGRSLTAASLLQALDSVNAVSRRLGAFFERYDVLLTPTLGALPAPLGRYDPEARLAPGDLFSGWAELESFLPAFNASGQPAISLPLHQSEEGLPIGMQLVGRFGDEATLIRLSARLEEALPWAGRLPPIHAAASDRPATAEEPTARAG